MAGSRLDRIGTIFSRTTGLLKAGAIKYPDRPLWYDVYRVFPPKYEPHIDREPEGKEIMDILYQEDKYRALYFKKFGLNPGGVPRVLGDRSFQDHSQSFVTICQELEKANPEWDKDTIFESASEKYKAQVPYMTDRKRGGYGDSDDLQEKADALNEASASKRHGRKPPVISAQSLLSLFKEAKEQQEQEADSKSEAKSDAKPTDKS